MRSILTWFVFVFSICGLSRGVGHDRLAAESAPKHVQFETSLGRFIVELDPKKAPKTVRNFIYHVKTGFYNGTIFHRVIAGFMVQAGGFEPSLHPKQTSAPAVQDSQNGLSNERGTIAMSREQSGNAGTSQFFINLANNKFLDTTPKALGYTVFGRVVDGMKVLDRIAAVPTTPRQHRLHVPVRPIVITRATVIDYHPRKEEGYGGL